MQLDPLFNALAEEQDHLLSANHRRAIARRRLLSGSLRPSSAPRSSLLRVGLAATLLSVCAVVAVSWMTRSPSQLIAEFGAARVPVSEGAWLDAPEGSSTPLRFSDGSEIELGPRGRVRMLALHPEGAHLALESGVAVVTVAHGEKRNWELRAGPFLVRVTGTKFDLAWDPNADSFDLSLLEGQVELVGCAFGSGKKLVAGQRVHASCRQNEVRIAYNQEGASPDSTMGQPQVMASVEPVAVAPDPREVRADQARRDATENATKCDACSPEKSLASSSTEANSAKSAKSDLDWAALARKGKYVDALRSVNQLGFSEQCARLRVDELALLCDTARHAGDAAKARSAYGQLRQRFPGSGQASLAAFHLGVLEFDHFGAHAKAAGWFRTYLHESPTGPLTREARGRLMEALHRTGSGDASGLASAYLRDYPSGPHAQLARRIVSSR